MRDAVWSGSGMVSFTREVVVFGEVVDCQFRHVSF
ncbi:MAG: hypothetical protein RIS92_1860 [Verrucomicrobiota bacterium]|jgi:hypothetical protein